MSDGARTLELIRSRRWFYEFDLPDGTRTASHLPPEVLPIHETRRRMVDAVLDVAFGQDRSALTAVDLACNQGWFALALAKRGFGRVLGVDGREHHLDDARLMAAALGIDRFDTRHANLEEVGFGDLGVHDLTLMLGLLYHLENPIRALRLARSLTRRVLIVETQVIPHLTGMVDWGASIYRRDVKGVFGIVDETEETWGTEASLGGLCLAPSAEGLSWLLGKVGFPQVVRVLPPPDGYEQLVSARRVMYAAFVDPIPALSTVK